MLQKRNVRAFLQNQYENSSISSIDNGIVVTKFSSLPSNPSGTVATTEQQRSLTATMHHPSAATHSWHWQLCLLDRVNKLEVAVPPGNWSQVQTNGQYFAPELFIANRCSQDSWGSVGFKEVHSWALDCPKRKNMWPGRKMWRTG